MGSRNIISPPHDFKQSSRWYYRVQERIKYVPGVVTYGITSIPNFMNFRPDILQLMRPTDIRHKCWVRVVYDANAQIMVNDVIIPPHDLKQPSRWYHRVHEGINYDTGPEICGKPAQQISLISVQPFSVY
jgi:hypothetical protein